MIKEKEVGQILSPCVRNCCLNQEDVCLGCYRTLEEILRWSKVSEQERGNIMLDAQQRKARYRNLEFSS